MLWEDTFTRKIVTVMDVEFWAVKKYLVRNGYDNNEADVEYVMDEFSR